MIRDISKMLEASPFEPFSLITSGGKEYFVATADHADVNPSGTRLIIWFDDESSVTVAGLHITSIRKSAVASES